MRDFQLAGVSPGQRGKDQPSIRFFAAERMRPASDS